MRFLFLGFARCGSCGYAITGEQRIKRSGLQYYYYRCTHKNRSKTCEERVYTSQARFEAEVKRNGSLLTLPDEWKEKFLARLESYEEEALAKKREKIARLKDELGEIKSKIDRLNTAFTEGTIDVDEFKELQNPLVPERVEIEQKIIALESTRRCRLEPFRNWIVEANRVNSFVEEENWSELRALLQRVGSNRILQAQVSPFRS